MAYGSGGKNSSSSRYGSMKKAGKAKENPLKQSGKKTENPLNPKGKRHKIKTDYSSENPCK